MTDYTFNITDTTYNVANTINMTVSDTITITQTYAGDYNYGLVGSDGKPDGMDSEITGSTYWTSVENGTIDEEYKTLYVTNSAIQLPAGKYQLRMGGIDPMERGGPSGEILIIVVLAPITLTAGHNYILSCKDAYSEGSAGIQSITQSGNSLTIYNKSPIDLIDLGAGTDTGDAKVIVNTPDGVFNAKDYRTYSGNLSEDDILSLAFSMILQESTPNNGVYIAYPNNTGKTALSENSSAPTTVTVCGAGVSLWVNSKRMIASLNSENTLYIAYIIGTCGNTTRSAPILYDFYDP